MTGLHCRIRQSAQCISFPVLKRVSRGRKISSNTFLNTCALWIWCSFTAVGFPCSLKWCFGAMGRRATRKLARFKGLDLMVQSMFPRLKYTGHHILSLELFEWCVWSELLNNGTFIAPSSDCNYWSGQTHCSYDEIELMYLFIPQPPAAWVYCWVDTFLSIMEFHC